MRLSESLRKNIMEANVGGVINKFKLHKRRDTLFLRNCLQGTWLNARRLGLGRKSWR